MWSRNGWKTCCFRKTTCYVSPLLPRGCCNGQHLSLSLERTRNMLSTGFVSAQRVALLLVNVCWTTERQADDHTCDESNQDQDNDALYIHRASFVIDDQASRKNISLLK